MQPITLGKYRMTSAFAVLVLLPVTGALWTMPDRSILLGLAILVSCLSVIAVFLEEMACAAIDREMVRLQTEVTNQSEKIQGLNEALREDDRIMAMLEQQNSRVSAELVVQAAHSEAA